MEKDLKQAIKQGASFHKIPENELKRREEERKKRDDELKKLAEKLAGTVQE